MTRPRQTRLKAKSRLSPSADAASGRAPSQPISTTSVAWIAAIGQVRQDQRPGKQQRRAKLGAPGAPLLVETIAARRVHMARARLAGWASLAPRPPVENPWVSPYFCSRPEPVKGDWQCGSCGRCGSCWWASRTRWSCLFMLMFFGLLYAGAVGAARRDRRRRAGDGPRRRAGRAGFAPRSVRSRRRCRQCHPRIRAARPYRRARRGQGRRAGSRRSRSTSTASSAAASRRSPRSARRSDEVKKSASRSSPLPPATPTTATSSPPMRPKSGCRRWASSRLPVPAATTSISRACSTSLE